MIQTPSRDQLVEMILGRLTIGRESIGTDFAATNASTTSFAVVDDLLPENVALSIAAAFPPSAEMRLMNSFRERKFTSKDLTRFDRLIRYITFAFQDPRVVASVAEMTGIRDAVGDPHLYAGGLSAMERGHFLNPHIDNSHDGEQRNYRVLNLLYYVTPDWQAENGGNLELWDERVTTPVEIPSLFNRLVLMATHDRSWHSVNQVRASGVRRCVSNYYFSPHSPSGHDVSHVTYFMARPEQKLRRVLTRIDSELRTALRRIRPKGFAKRDVYGGD